MTGIKIDVVRTKGNENMPLPRYQSEGAAGLDLTAAVQAEQVIQPGEIKLIPTGLKMVIPLGYEGQVRPRSGLALRHGIGVLNAPGTIDSDYRGEVSIILFNFGQEAFAINRGDRIAQLVIASVERVEVNIVQELSESSRGEGGFGSTGKK